MSAIVDVLTRRPVEAIVLGGVGAAMAGAVGSLFEATIPFAIVGGLNGLISGYRRIYDWSCSHGPIAFTLDSTWGLVMTVAGLFANGVGLVTDRDGYVAGLSERRNRHVYRSGFRARKGFVITLGNVISSAGEVEGARRARLITDHEDVHVWQARWLGPLYPVLYVGWSAVGALVGLAAWVVRRGATGEKIGATVETASYYNNPLEWWAYSRDDHWPPGRTVLGLRWGKPACPPLTVAKPWRPSGLAQFRGLLAGGAAGGAAAAPGEQPETGSRLGDAIDDDASDAD